MVEFIRRFFQAKQFKINYDENLKLNINNIFNYLKKKVSLLILSNPNSPTGTIIDELQLLEFYKKQKDKTAVFYDEAYFGLQIISDPTNSKI